MDLKQLEAFLAVVERHSFSKAAAQLYLTQPTVSAHIGTLEKELGTKLIVRAPKGVFPTEDGVLLGEYARDMLTLRDNALNWFENKRSRKQQTIPIAASSVPAQYVLPHLMAAFCRERPDAAFEILRCDSEAVVHEILSRRAQFGLAGTKTESDLCVFEELCKDRLVVITPNNEHYRSLKDSAEITERLAEEPFLVREQGSGTRRESEGFLRELGIDPARLHIVAQMEDPESIKQAVSQGMGAAIVSELGVLDYERFEMLQVLRFPKLSYSRSLYLVTHRENHMTPAARQLCDFIRESYRKKE